MPITYCQDILRFPPYTEVGTSESGSDACDSTGITAGAPFGVKFGKKKISRIWKRKRT